jgi:hypothetical protein
MKEEEINIIVLGAAIMLLILEATALAHMILILPGTTHRTMIIRLANAIAHLIIVASAIYKTMSTIDLEAQEASVMADQRTQDMSVVHLHLPMAMERRCIELQLMHFIELRTPKTMLMHRMVAI